MTPRCSREKGEAVTTITTGIQQQQQTHTAHTSSHPQHTHTDTTHPHTQRVHHT
jgi:hypothetical protein